MKINWGTGLVIGMLVFMTFIMIMVVTMITNKEYNHDMVTENYYEKDLAYQNEINALKNTNTLSNPLIIKKKENGLNIIFPQEFDNQKVKCKVEFYRPSNEILDFNINRVVENKIISITHKNLVKGNWEVKISWQMNNKNYLYKKEIVY